MTWNVRAQEHFHLVELVRWECSLLTLVQLGRTMLSSKVSWGAFCDWPAAMVAFSLILQSILIFSRWVELQPFLIDSRRQTPHCPADQMPLYSSVHIPDEMCKTSGSSPEKTFWAFMILRLTFLKWISIS